MKLLKDRCVEFIVANSFFFKDVILPLPEDLIMVLIGFALKKKMLTSTCCAIT
jgi:membrane protein DedA with SNARE-associated domain